MACFEFELDNIKNLKGVVYTPRFETLPDIFWQLRFEPTSSTDPEYCDVALLALRNSNEVDYFDPVRNHCLPAEIYLKTITGWVLRIDDTGPFKLDHIVACRLYINRFCKKSHITDKIIFGVKFQKIQLGIIRFNTPFPAKQIPQELISAWANELNSSSQNDVKFTIQGRSIVAKSCILSKRSEYFRRMFSGTWSECFRTKNLINNSINDLTSNLDDKCSISKKKESWYRYKIEIIDFKYETFFKMLQFLYSDSFVYNSLEDLWDIYSVADKYLITDLLNRAKSELLLIMSYDNVADMYFGNAFKYPDLKKVMMDFIIENFGEVKKTDGWKAAFENKSKYTAYQEL
ncbi:16419_t:CDS:2, partial [Cetraspora pellucida]